MQAGKFKVLIKVFSFWVLWLSMLHFTGALQGFFPQVLISCIYGILGSIYAFLLTWIYLHFEKKSFRDIGLVWQLKTPLRFFYGVLIGAAIFATITFLLLIFGRLHLTRTNISPANILISAITLFWLALMEEVAFRSYPFLKLKNNFGLWGAQFIAAIAFASYHFAIGWPLQSVLIGPFVWAFVYGLAAVWSRGIALPAGLHMMLNIGQTLTGMTSTSSAIWKIDFNNPTHSNLQPILILIHAFILFVTLILTGYFIKKSIAKVV